MKVSIARAAPVALALLAAAVLLVVAWKLDEQLPRSDRRNRVPIEDLVAPDPLSEAERAALRARTLGGSTVRLDEGAWVQVAGKDGRLAQQYAAQRIDPQPGAYMSMVSPRAVFFLDDGRVVTLRSLSARVHVPNRALESGQFVGEVVVRMYRPSKDGRVDLMADSPALVLETEQLEFDQVIGALECPGPFRLTTDLLTFDGEGLELALAADGKTIERLFVDHALGPIVIDRGRMGGARADQSPSQPGMYLASAVANRTASTSEPLASPATQSAAAPFYRLELRESVEVLRYSGTDRAWSRGDVLTAIFTLQSDLVTKGIVRGSTTDGLDARGDALHAGAPPAQVLAAALAAPTEPRASEDLIVVRFAGSMLLEPAGPKERVPATPGDMLVALDGEVVELATDAQLALRAKEIDIDLAKGAEAVTTPRLLVATGAVEATDSLQTLWCDAMRAQFEAQAGAAGVDPALGAAEVSRVDAQGPLQVQLKDGARLFAGAMEAYPREKRATLAGPNVTLVRAGVLIEGLPELRVDEVARSASSAGAGRARAWEQPLLAGAPRARVAPPSAPSGAPQIDAAWTDSMAFVDRAEAGAVLDLAGRVRVRAQPKPEEFDALDAMRVRLELEPAGTGAPLGSVPPPSGPAGGDVRPRRLHATGDVRMENQTWTDGSRTGEPRLFQVRADDIDYDARAGEAHIEGAGSALVYVPPGSSRDARVAKARERDALVPGGGVEGISRFRWGKSMSFKRVVDDRWLMTMDASVELVRAGARKDDTLTLTCDRLEATLERGVQAVPSGAAPAFDLGSSAEVKRVRGVGRCFIRTPQYDIECEEFDYDTVTQVALLHARPGRLVNVLPKGQGSPMRAASVVWDLASGRIEIRAASR
jgi:hypothetical protein